MIWPRRARRARPTPPRRRPLLLEPLEARTLLSGDLLIDAVGPQAFVYNLLEYTQQGVLVRSYPVSAAPGSGEGADARGLSVGPSGDVSVYDGTFTPSLATLSAATHAWSYQTYPGWSTVANVSYGGVAAYNNFIFATDMATYGDPQQPANGIVRFDLSGGPAVRFDAGTDYQKVALGRDGLLYGLRGGFDTVHVFDPATLAPVRIVRLDGGPGGDLRDIAVDPAGQIFAVTWNGYVVKYGANGSYVASIPIPGPYGGSESLMSIALDADGQVAVGGRDGGIYLTDESLAAVRTIQTNRGDVFVTFDHYIGTAPAGPVAVAGSGQSASAGAGFAAPLQALVTDGHGHPVPGVVVTFTAPSSGPGATFYGNPVATALTDANGVATAPLLTANYQAGAYTVSASAPGYAALASFALTSTAAAPAAVTAAGGSGQSATAGTAFAAPLQARVTDAYGNPVPGARVTFAAPSTGPGGSFGGSATATATTDANGLATAPALTAGPRAGAYAATATASGLAAAFALANTPGAPAAVTAVSGGGQAAAVGTPFGSALQALAADAHGNPVPGVLVTFTAPTSGPGGTFFGNPVAQALTGADGVATAPLLTGNDRAGSFSVTASVPGVTAASFAATSTPLAPAAVAAAAGSGQSATVGASFASPLRARVTDAYGNPIAGVPVTFTAPSSGATGSFGGSATTTATTDAAGLAAAPALTAGARAGGYGVTATVSGVAAAASFDLTNAPGAPAAVAADSGSGQSATVGASFPSPLAARVTDAHGNPVAGVLVTFTAPASGPGGTFYGNPVARALSDADGVATAPLLTADYQVGAYNLTASVSGVADAAVFAASNTAGAPAAVTVAGGSGQAAAVGTPFAAALQARVTDAHGLPVPGVIVSFSAPSSGPGGSFYGNPVADALTDADGVATAPQLTAGYRAGTFSVTASVSGVTAAASFAATSTPGTPAAVVAAAGSGQAGGAGSPFAVPLQARVTDAYGNPVPGALVTFAAPASGPGGSFFGAPTAPAYTDANGLAVSPLFTANGQVGGYGVTASVTGVGAAATFTLTNTAGAPAAVVAATGAGQATALGTPFAVPLQARVTDAYGNPVAGVLVTFTAPASGPGGSFFGAPTGAAYTDGTGTAVSPLFTANGLAGDYTVTASVAGLDAFAPFVLTNLGP